MSYAAVKREPGGALLEPLPDLKREHVNVTPWREDLLALMEATPPVAVSLSTLESRGETDLDGASLGALQAHFHRVDRSVIWREPDGLADKPFEPSYARGTLDLRREEATWQERWHGGCEFPRTNPRFHAVPNRYTWLAAQRPEAKRKGWPDRLVCVDTETGSADWKAAGERCAIGEPTLVPRGADERDLWVLALVWDVDKAATYLAVWNGASLEEMPVARVWFDQEVPLGLHGCWIPA